MMLDAFRVARHGWDLISISVEVTEALLLSATPW